MNQVVVDVYIEFCFKYVVLRVPEVRRGQFKEGYGLKRGMS